MPAGSGAEDRQELAQNRVRGGAYGLRPYENADHSLNLRVTAGPERLLAYYCPSFRTSTPRGFPWGVFFARCERISKTQKPPRRAALRFLRGGRINLERARRFERPTLTLARLCSTPELRPHPVGEAGIPIWVGGCKRENGASGVKLVIYLAAQFRGLKTQRAASEDATL